MVKFSHSVFAMPFGLTGLFLGFAETREFDPLILFLVVFGLVFVRNAAMGFNRWADRKIDAENVRTKDREIPAGVISTRQALLFVVVNGLLFIATTYFINPLCFYLSPVALTVVLGYSLTKRFTALCHIILGLGLSLSPVGAYIAVTGYLTLDPILLGIAVLTWVSGFDIIYALQDEEFDRTHNLYSIPTYLGKNRALLVSGFLHFVTAAVLAFFIYTIEGQYLAWTAFVFFVCLLVYQHLIVKPNDLSRVNLAFFTTNGIASIIFGILVILDILVLSFHHSFSFPAI